MKLIWFEQIIVLFHISRLTVSVSCILLVMCSLVPAVHTLGKSCGTWNPAAGTFSCFFGCFQKNLSKVIFLCFWYPFPMVSVSIPVHVSLFHSWYPQPLPGQPLHWWPLDQESSARAGHLSGPHQQSMEGQLLQWPNLGLQQTSGIKTALVIDST